jgi:hypothetical protein
VVSEINNQEPIQIPKGYSIKVTRTYLYNKMLPVKGFIWYKVRVEHKGRFVETAYQVLKELEDFTTEEQVIRHVNKQVVSDINRGDFNTPKKK